MSGDPRVSVAMATYNGARFIAEQLESLSRQTLPPCELVIGDDGSTDDTLNIVEAFARTAPFPVRIHRNPQRMGHADNFLHTATLCSGDLIAFCDQDDVWLETKLARCCQAFQDRDVVLAVHAAHVVDTNLTRLGRRTQDTTVAGTGAPWLESMVDSLRILHGLLRQLDETVRLAIPARGMVRLGQ